jgi:hypothetical protein
MDLRFETICGDHYMHDLLFIFCSKSTCLLSKIVLEIIFKMIFSIIMHGLHFSSFCHFKHRDRDIIPQIKV